MSFQVLQNEKQIHEARRILDDRGLSAMTGARNSAIKRLISRSRIADPLIIGDVRKSWDILATVRFIEDRFPKDASILDIGCYGSEALLAMHNAGFTNLSGVDLDPRIRNMPHQDSIRYVTGNFMATPFEDESFDAITAISVIEHGYDGPRLLSEMSRLLKPGGTFLASVDYWQDKIDTGNTRYFDMSWLLFSAEDVQALIAEAAKHRLRPVGDLQFSGSDRTIEHGGYEYTFAWLALEKLA